MSKAIINVTRVTEAAALVCVLGVVGSLDINTVSLGRGVAYIAVFIAAGLIARAARAWIRRDR